MVKLEFKNLICLPTRLFKAIYWRLRTGRFGLRSVIISPLRIEGAANFYIGNKVTIEYKSWLAANPLTGIEAKLVIEDGCSIGHFNHIYATKSVVLHRDVLTADKVYISDNLHGYDEIDIPIKDQPIKQNGEVEIGEGSWIGENVCVLGAKIGKHCVIGANSVVTKNIPDYSVAVGAPAKVIKKYDFNTNSWQKVDSQENTQKNGGGNSSTFLLAA